MKNSICRKNQYRYLICLILVLGCYFAKAQQIDLSKSAWQFKKSTDKEWLNATVPGSVHTDLMANKKIPDPFYRNNEKDLQWIEKADWEYRTHFIASDELLTKDSIDLKFDGLDTYADVYLNNKLILKVNNMFRSWKIEVKSMLNKGDNQLHIYFHSPINKVMPVYDSLHYTIPVSNNDQADKRVSVFTRKAGYHYGWDWGPRFVTSGIWRPVTLTGWNKLSIADVFINQLSLDNQKANLAAELEVNATENGIKTLEISIDDNRKTVIKKQTMLYKGHNNLSAGFTIARPQLWWPNGMGQQKLYHFTVSLRDAGGKLIASKTVRRGLRNIQVVRESDERGRSFYFKVNGIPVFMKGANYIPQDNFLPRVNHQRLEHMLNSARISHMNMLRVWGGGIYQDDDFYNLCDEKGLLIWQDFMFACALFPPFEDLKQNIYAEAVENVKRLRNHPCVALWCGNNEIVDFFNSGFWGQVKKTWTNPQDSVALFNTYKDIFHNVLPAALKAYDADKFYWSTSPATDNFSMTSNKARKTGDSHYWDVWGGTEKIEQYNNNVPRFMSEYGFQSFPELATVKQFANKSDFEIGSSVMTSHQRSNRGNAGITEYMHDWFVQPDDFEQFLYVGQLLQAEAIRTAIEAHRRAMPFCMGSLYWQIDDCWPAASWSSIDYTGRWKALQYQAKRSFATVLLSAYQSGHKLELHLVSDSLKRINGNLQIKLIDFDGRVLKQIKQPVKAGANASAVVTRLNWQEWLGNHPSNRVVLVTTFSQGQKELARNLYYFDKPKNLMLPEPAIHYTVNKTINGFSVTLGAAKLARFVKVAVGDENLMMSDNYFDLLPGKPVVITFKSALSLDAVKKSLNIISLKTTMIKK